MPRKNHPHKDQGKITAEEGNKVPPRQKEFGADQCI